jgi:hypothetical protein
LCRSDRPEAGDRARPPAQAHWVDEDADGATETVVSVFFVSVVCDGGGVAADCVVELFVVLLVVLLVDGPDGPCGPCGPGGPGVGAGVVTTVGGGLLTTAGRSQAASAAAATSIGVRKRSFIGSSVVESCAAHASVRPGSEWRPTARCSECIVAADPAR